MSRPRGPGHRVQKDGGRAVTQRSSRTGPSGAGRRRQPLPHFGSVLFLTSAFSVTFLASKCVAFEDR